MNAAVEWRGATEPPEAKDGDVWIDGDGNRWLRVDGRWLSAYGSHRFG